MSGGSIPIISICSAPTSPWGDVVLYENGFLCFEGSLFRVEEGAAYQRCLELCREALP